MVEPDVKGIKPKSFPRKSLPKEYYIPYLSNLSKERRPNGIRGLFPLELLPNMLSLLAGKPAPQTFPITSFSFTVRSPESSVSNHVPDIPVSVSGPALDEALQYSATRGIPSLVGWVEGLQERFHGRNPKGEGWSCAIGSGSQDLLYKAFHSLLNPGDSIFVEAPVYSGVLPILQSLHADMIEIPTDAQGARSSDLRKMLENWPSGKPIPRVMYTVPYGCNPTGTTASLDRRLEVLELARKYDFLIMEDDPYFYLYYGEAERPASYFHLEAQDWSEPVGRVLRFDSFSKILSAGLRLGFVCGPEPIIDAIIMHTSSANLQVSSTSQAIGFALLNTLGYDGFERHTQGVSQYYRERRDVFEKAMRHHFGSGLAEWATPEAGMFVWFKLKLSASEGSPEGDSNALIAQRAVAKGVLAIPGTSFFPNGRTSAYVRASFSTIAPEHVDEALRRLAEVVREYNEEQWA
ncbi:hypothetical protein FRB94_000974 [Tulasnella sp. JGI-2019a]|nr:hypothetical protein FRB94_000974 [Tulasnella sp. JGI-2019a]KAG9003424.1 hypothetical protein FRB93_011047 [Tulasnella sp. JGI-2019a]